jgi:DnaK suppressor protein
MFVSLLQLLGFPVGNPVHSRAKEVVQSQPSEADIEGITAKALEPAVLTRLTSSGEVQRQANSARRLEVKTQTGKPKVASKAANAVAKDKPVVTTVAKPLANAKPAVKAKPPVKVPVEAAPAKAVKPTAKVKVQEKDTVKTTTAKASNPEVVVSKPKTHSVKPGTIAKAAQATKSVMAAPVVPVETSSVPARAGRPSSRLAQLTVPSMAQSVASTAAKASFTQTTSAPIIVPPLASAVKKDPALANNWKLKPVEQLTDADVIAMPDDEYMNDTQLAFFRLKLSVLKKDILSNAGETTEHLREETVVVPDPTDRATIEEEHALELRTRDRERKLLKKIEQSIVRIDAGEYGYCDETGEPIGVGRLLARPTANLSLEAQQRRELRQKMFGD